MRALLAALHDLLSGLFTFPSHRGASGAAIEARYRNTRRCC
jgi:hypothetical protein